MVPLQSKLLDMARDLLFNDNRAKLNDETLQKLAFLNGTAHQEHNARLTGVPELNSTGEQFGLNYDKIYKTGLVYF